MDLQKFEFPEVHTGLTFKTIPELLEEATNRGFYNGQTKYNDLSKSIMEETNQNQNLNQEREQEQEQTVKCKCQQCGFNFEFKTVSLNFSILSSLTCPNCFSSQITFE